MTPDNDNLPSVLVLPVDQLPPRWQEDGWEIETGNTLVNKWVRR